MRSLDFQYAKDGNSKCEECKEKIELDTLEIECFFEKPIGHQKYHFQCLIDAFSFDSCRKSDIKILLERDPNNPTMRSVSLEDFDSNPDKYKLAINEADLTKIREQIALAKDHKTAYYIPIASKTDQQIECPKFCLRNPSTVDAASGDGKEEELQLYLQEYYYHPKCLFESGQVNVDAKEIAYYNALDDNDKVLLDGIFKKDEGPCNHPTAFTKSVDAEYCSSLKCYTVSQIKGLRIRYKTKVYHPKCFNEMWVVNIEGHEIGNYDALADTHKEYLINLFEKWDDFDIPLLEKAKECDYCNADECLVSELPSKFPWPYTITKDQLQIKFHGGIYHARCFQGARKTNLSVENFWGYSDLSKIEKQFLNEIFMHNDVVVDRSFDDNDSSSNHVLNNDVMDVDDDEDVVVIFEPPPSKKSRLTDPMEFNNASTINQIQGEGNAMETSFDDKKVNVKKESRVIHIDFDESWSQTNESRQENDGANQGTETEVKQEPPQDTVSSNTEMQSCIGGSNSSGNVQPPNNVDMEDDDSDVVILADSDDEIPPPPSSRSLINKNNVGSGRIFNTSVGGRLGGNGFATSNDNTTCTATTSLPLSKPIKKEPKTEVIEEMDTVDSVECVHAGYQLSYQFEAPNDAFIRSTLQKLNIPFNRQALYFWAQVLYTVIPTTSTPTSTFAISSSDDSFFKCLSSFFTGNQNKYICVKAGIQAYFYNNFKTFGTIDGIDFSKLDVTSDHFQQLYECKKITNIHFNIICSWLKCRIGIYSSAHLEKYGSWDEESHPILLMQNENGFFKPVLSLI